MRLGWYEGTCAEGQPAEFVNLDACWRLAVEPTTSFASTFAVWAFFGDKKVMLAGTEGTQEQAVSYLKAIFEDEEIEAEV